jgi:hypothetical protein
MTGNAPGAQLPGSRKVWSGAMHAVSDERVLTLSAAGTADDVARIGYADRSCVGSAYGVAIRWLESMGVACDRH